ncbi:MAG: hypothetical protein KBG15_12695 [Kofleriaceae bacterium]|nr:hypothetical protein [Kofleriaceae bacterium]
MGQRDVIHRGRQRGWPGPTGRAWLCVAATLFGSMVVAGACKRPSSVPVSGLAPRGGSGGNSPSAARCVPAHFAAIVECKTEGFCVGVFSVDAACVATMRNEINLGGEVTRIIALAWPRSDGPLYAVVERATTPAWAWTRIDVPRTAAATTVAGLTWHDETFAQKDPDGVGFGIVTDGRDVVLTGCAQWDSDNEEEWHCASEVYWSIFDQRLLPTLPLPPLAQAWRAGKLGDNVVVRDGADATVECRVAGAANTPTRYATPAAVTVLTHDDYLLWYAAGGSRSSPIIGWDVIARRGCGVHPAMVGQTALGPHGYWANRSNPYSRNDTAKWTIHQRDMATSLLGSDGKPMLVDSDSVVWATSP